MKLKIKNLLALLGFLAVSQAAGLIGSVFTVGAILGWYAGLVKPELAPPNWVFGPVWTILYILMGIAAFLVWRKDWQKREIKVALSLFGVQLILNALWSIIFFGLQNPGAALVEIGFLWVAIVATMISFARVSSWAAGLLVPYLAWVSFATYLNYIIWIAN